MSETDIFLQGSGLIRIAQVVLTDEEIKALPTTPIEILAAPGPGKLSIVITSSLILNAVAEAYTNVNVDGIVSLVYLSGGLPFSQASLSHSANIFTDNDPNLPMLQLPPYFETPPYEYAYGQNKPIGISVGNPVNNDFTGGNVANSLKVTLLYAILDV